MKPRTAAAAMIQSTAPPPRPFTGRAVGAHWRWLAGVLLASIALGFVACGPNGAGDADWERPPTPLAEGAVTGRVLAPIVAALRTTEPVAGGGSSPALPLVGSVATGLTGADRVATDAAMGTSSHAIIVADAATAGEPPVPAPPGSIRGAGLGGVTVYLESRPDLTAVSGPDGSFVIYAVPVGYHRVIAETLVAGRTYRQRSASVRVVSSGHIAPLPEDVQLALADRVVELTVIDSQSQAPLAGVEGWLWGKPYRSGASGVVSLGPVPGGAYPVALAATGYHPRGLTLSFERRRQDLLQLGLVPRTAIDANQPPLIELTREFDELLTFQNGGLLANGQDPEGDRITFAWETTGGTLAQPDGPSNILTAPAVAGRFQVTVTGRDGKGGAGRASLWVTVSGGGIPVNPNNHPPNNPVVVFPADGTSNLGTQLELAWLASDTDGDRLSFDVFLGLPGQEIAQIASQVAEPRYTVSNLLPGMLYFWKIVARDPSGAINPNSAVWQFRIGYTPNNPPLTPANPTPENHATGQTRSLLLTWTGGDPDPGDRVTYEIRMASGTNDLAPASTTRNTRLVLADLAAGTEYFWQVVARDDRGAVTAGPPWRFTTAPLPNQAPMDPVAATPASGAVDVALLPRFTWSQTDPDGDPLSADVFLGTGTPLVQVASGTTTGTYVPDRPLAPNTQYFWQVVLRDPRGGVNPNPTVFSFTTTAQVNRPPGVPDAILPAPGASGVALNAVLSWQCRDPDGDALTYDVLLDPTPSPTTMVARALTEPSWTVTPALEAGRTYSWQVIARDPFGESTTSAVFSFITEPALDTQPPRLVSFSPASGATDVDPAAAVAVVFSEAMDRVSVEGAISATPGPVGNAVWDDDTRIRLIRATPRHPGSFHLVQVAPSCRDLAGNLMAAGTTWSYTVAARLPVPSGWRSPGFGVTVPVGSTLDLDVTGILPGGELRALLLDGATAAAVEVTASARTSSATDGLTSIRSKQLSERFADAPEALGTELGRALLIRLGDQLPTLPTEAPSWLPPDGGGTGTPSRSGGTGNPTSGAGRSTLRADTAVRGVGTREFFYVPAFEQIATTTAYPANRFEAECFAATDRLLLFVDVAIPRPSGELLGQIRAEFEERIQPRMRDQFGDEPATGPDGEPRLTILLTNAMRENVLGLFNPADLFARSPFDQQLRESNARKLFYMRYSDTFPGDPATSRLNRFGTMAHEFQHLINFHQKRRAGGATVAEETWLNEGLSKYAEEVCGYGPLEGERNTATLVEGFLTRANSMSLTNWENVYNYGYSYLFVRFLAEAGRYGTTSREVTRRLVMSRETGPSNVEAVTAAAFQLVRARFGLSLMLNRHTTGGTDYGLQGFDLTGTVAGVRLPGVPWQSGSINDLTVPGNGFVCWRRPAVGGAARLGIRSLEPLSVWAIDQRP